eukprot:5729336-Amphidinium_carterae.1
MRKHKNHIKRPNAKGTTPEHGMKHRANPKTANNRRTGCAKRDNTSSSLNRWSWACGKPSRKSETRIYSLCGQDTRPTLLRQRCFTAK